MLQIPPRSYQAEVVIVGSGAGGGTVAKVLTDLGLNVTLLEAGPSIDPSVDFQQGVWPYQFAHRGAGPAAEFYNGKLAGGFFTAPNGFWEDPAEPYSVAPEQKFRWFRSRILGGRTNQFGRVMPRFSEYDFKPYSQDGLGVDWPIAYDDIAPYYEKAESFIGITGSAEGLPSAPDGVFLPPPAPRVHEILLRRAGQTLGMPAIASRLCMLTEARGGRPACHYCGQCTRGCRTGAAYSSPQTMIFPAVEGGKLTLITGAMVRELVLNGEGRVESVLYIDKATGGERRLTCRVIVLAASACESARILLNSKSSRSPDGLANGSGAVGRWLTDTPMHTLFGLVPALEGLPRHNSDGVGAPHLYFPSQLPDQSKLSFPRGYHLQMGGGFYLPEVGNISPLAYFAEGYGDTLMSALRSTYGSLTWLTGFGEMIPNQDSYCEIDPDGTLDRFGIPVLRFHWSWSENELEQVGDMYRTSKAILESAGGSALTDPNEPNASRISTGGSGIHELGCIRMGDNPDQSPLNRWCQAHEVPNLFVADGAVFASNPEKNPTLTLIALAWRTAEYLAEKMRTGDV